MRPRGNLLDSAPSDAPGYIEAWARSGGLLPLMGVDEAGRGCLAGPVVAAAVVLPDPHPIRGLNDSKLLAPAERDRLEAEVRAVARAVGVGLAGPARIDQVNILAATLEAMRSAIEQAAAALDRGPGIVVVDGNRVVPGVPWPQKTWVKGDRLSENVAAASIVAKVYRDRLLEALDAEHPGYGFAVHKGYGTPEHLEAIRRLGPCPIHRMTFAPLKGGG